MKSIQGSAKMTQKGSDISGPVSSPELNEILALKAGTHRLTSAQFQLGQLFINRIAWAPNASPSPAHVKRQNCEHISTRRKV